MFVRHGRHERHADRQGRAQAIEVASRDGAHNAGTAITERAVIPVRIAPAADGAILEGTVVPPLQPGAASRQRNAVWLGVGLVAATRVLHNRRFDEQVIVAIFALAALTQLGWKELVRAFRDLIAWDNARLADLDRQLRREREANTGQREPADDGHAGNGAGRGSHHDRLCHESGDDPSPN